MGEGERVRVMVKVIGMVIGMVMVSVSVSVRVEGVALGECGGGDRE